MGKVLKWVIGGVVAVAVLVSAGTFVYIHFIQGTPPARLTLESGSSSQPADTPATSATSTPSTTASTTPSAAAATGSGVSGTYQPTPASVVGYRVKEILFGQSNEAVGRTSDVSGSMTVDGARVTDVNLTVNMKSVKSDSGQRDGQFQTRIMNTSTYPTATFTLTQPLALSGVPSDSSVVDATATGDLTLHGVTKSVTFDLKAQRDGFTIKVNGTIPVVFADYRIANPSAGPATTQDNGVLEFLVVFQKAA